MREISEAIKKWQAAGKPVAVATIVKTDGSSLRPLGSKMAATNDQQIAGSVTGGCIEGAVYEEAQQVLRSGKPKIVRYGTVGDQTPWEIGLSCGTSIDVLIEPLSNPTWLEILEPIQNAFEQHELVACATLLTGEALSAKLLVWPDGQIKGTLGSQKLDSVAKETVLMQMKRGDSGNATVTLAGQSFELFIDVFTPPARLIVVGAVHIAIPLVTLAKTLGFTTLIVDPRKTYASRERFPNADQLVIEWPAEALERLKPDAGTCVAAVSHDEKLDNPALAVALKSDARYVGVLGNRRNIPNRLDALRALGVNEEQLTRLHAPIGLDIGGVSPEEIALAVLAEITAVRHGCEFKQDTHARLKKETGDT